METKVNYMLVGLFVIVLGLTLVGVVLWLGKGGYGTTYDLYYTYMRESVSGLSVNAPVKYRGVEVGRVKEIILNPENTEEVRLTLDIIRGTPIKEDTLAVLDTQGLTGLASINLTGGSRDSPGLGAKSGETYPVIQSGPSLFFRLDSALSRLLADETLPRLLANLNGLARETRTMVSEENRVAMRAILHDLKTVTRTLAGRSEAIDEGVVKASDALASLAKVTAKLRDKVPDLLQAASQAAQALQGMTEEVSRTGARVSVAVEEARPNLEYFSRQALPEAGLLIGELRELTASLQRLTRQLEQHPNSLVFGRPAVPPGPGE